MGTLYKVFGVRAKDMEEARRLVEVITGLRAQSRESSDLGGDYYAFGDVMNGECLKLVNNRDVYDNEPVVNGADEWPIALFINRTAAESPLLKKLLAATSHLVPAA